MDIHDLPPEQHKMGERQEKLAEGVEQLDRGSEGDRVFFERHRSRNHRLRRADQIEVEPEEIARDSRERLPIGAAWFVIVEQLSPGVRVRALVMLPEETHTDISETECEQLFIRLLGQGADR